MPTLDGRVLIGWMEESHAIRYLTKDCYFDPPLTEEAARTIWCDYRHRVEALGPRVVEPVTRHPFKYYHENEGAKKFRQMYPKATAPNILDVVKVELTKLLAWQLYVVVDQAEKYAERVKGAGWLKETLLALPKNVPMKVRQDGKAVSIELPHAEHMLNLNQDGKFEIQQGARFSNVAEIGGRMLLATGYHRAFAHSRNVMNVPDAIDRAVLVALTSNLPFLDTPETQGLKAMLLGDRPPFFADFFDDRLFMPVRLLKKRFEMRISVEIVPVDEAP